MKPARPRPTPAERMRRHREAFQLAQQLGCTPLEAEAELATRAARERWLKAKARLDAKLAARPRATPSTTTEEERSTAWWQRD